MLGSFLAIAIIGLVITAHGVKDRWDRPLGVDFSGVWIAGQAVRAGYPAQPYDNAAHAAAQATAFGPSDSFLPWPYPPYALTIAAILAGLPYLVALAVWQGTTFLLYLAGVLRAVRGSTLSRRHVFAAALAFPAVALNLTHGQNGFLSAGLLALGAFNLPARPLLGGALLGLLAYKPQFAIAVPLALAAGGYWRAALAGLAALAAMTLGTWLALGNAPWCGFAASLSFTRHVVLEGGGLESFKLLSAFAAVRLLGGSVVLAYVAQGCVALVVLAALAWIWRTGCDHRLKVGALILASLLVTPYAVDYDLAMTGPAIAALVAYDTAHGSQPYHRSVLAAAWAMPLVARLAGMLLGIPLGFLVLAVLFGTVVSRVRRACQLTNYFG
jgi:hypothetical protein